MKLLSHSALPPSVIIIPFEFGTISVTLSNNIAASIDPEAIALPSIRIPLPASPAS